MILLSGGHCNMLCLISFEIQIMTLGGNAVLMIALIICVAIVGSEEHNIVSLIVVQVNVFFLSVCLFLFLVCE